MPRGASLSAAVATDLRTGRAACFRGAAGGQRGPGSREAAANADGRGRPTNGGPGRARRAPRSRGRTRSEDARNDRKRRFFARIEGRRAIAPVAKRGGAAVGR